MVNSPDDYDHIRDNGLIDMSDVDFGDSEDESPDGDETTEWEILPEVHEAEQTPLRIACEAYRDQCSGVGAIISSVGLHPYDIEAQMIAVYNAALQAKNDEDLEVAFRKTDAQIDKLLGRFFCEHAQLNEPNFGSKAYAALVKISLKKEVFRAALLRPMEFMKAEHNTRESYELLLRGRMPEETESHQKAPLAPEGIGNDPIVRGLNLRNS